MGQDLRDLELLLISGSSGSSQEETDHQLFDHVLKGDFKLALSTPDAKEFLRLPSVSSSASLDTLDLGASLPLHLNSIADEKTRELTQLAVGVACLHAFVQENWTGPPVAVSPSDVVSISDSHERIDEVVLNDAAVRELASGGEPAYHLAKKTAFLRLAQLVFDLEYQHLTTPPWWSLRATIVHQQLLEEAVGLPPSFYAPLESILQTLQGDLAGSLLLEQGLLHHHLREDRAAAALFVRAARAYGLEYELSGALGKRTRFQQNDLSQLVLLAQSRNRTSPTASSAQDAATAMPDTLALNDDTILEHIQFVTSSSSSTSASLAQLDPGNQPALHPLDQCVLLSLCLNVRNTQPEHGLTSEEMTPYVSRVVSHPRNWSVHTMALLLRARLESTRSRTVERSVLQLQALIDQMPTADSTASERLAFIHEIPLPSKWDMERELAMRYLSLGVVRSAMEIFERLEMWEEVVKCWQSLEQPEKAKAIVRDLLEGRIAEVDAVLARGRENVVESRRAKMDSTRESKLWCLLGDLEPENAATHYTKAWNVSKDTSGRAARSLGGYFFARGKFDQSASWLKKAVGINSLMSRSWFLLGCASVRLESWIDARDAFARCVTIDEDDGESWNNLASVYLRMDVTNTQLLKGSHREETFTDDDVKAQKRVPVENKILAFRALKQGLKFSYDNWRMWQNYMIVCMDIGEFAEATRALGRIVEELSEKKKEASIDFEVLDRLVDAVVTPSPQDPSKSPEEIAADPDRSQALSRRLLDIFERVILPRSASSSEVFTSYARLLHWYGDRPADELEARKNAFRCSVVDDEAVDTNVERWRAAIGEVRKIVGYIMELGPHISSASASSITEASLKGESNAGTETKEINWAFQARSFVRSFMARTKATYEDEPEWEEVQEVLDSTKS